MPTCWAFGHLAQPRYRGNVIRRCWLVVLPREDVLTDLDTLVTDEDRWSSDQSVDCVLILVAERATQNRWLILRLHRFSLFLLPVPDLDSLAF
jgi:hypothetical protein